MICKICGVNQKALRYLSGHLNKYHSMSLEDYVLKFEYNNIRPKCKCGCNSFTKFNKIDYRDYCHNHWHKTKHGKERLVSSLKKAMQKKYGVDNPMYLNFVKDKIKKTNLEKHGTEWAINSLTVKEKTLKTFERKYGKGVTNVSQVKEIKEKIYIEQRHSFDDIKNICREKKYIPLFSFEIYKNHREYLKFKCLIHNLEFDSQLFFIKQGTNQCPKCKIHGYSNKEKELCAFIKNIYNGVVIENSRKIISPYELDIFLPELRVGLEFNGTYWHSTEHAKVRDARKEIICEKKGIHLLIISEELWDNKQNEVKDSIRSLLSDRKESKCFSTTAPKTIAR